MDGSDLLLLAIGAISSVIALLLFRASPKLAFALWLVVLFFVPVWIGVRAGFFWAAITAVTLVVLVATFSNLRLTLSDVLMGAFVLIAIALYALRMASLSATVIALLEWVLPYAYGRIVFGRLSPAFVGRAVAAAATVAAALAIVEFATRYNVFVSSMPPLSAELFATWGLIQERGGLPRVEGAFGHSIAFGAALAMSSAFVLTTRWPVVVRLLCLSLVTISVILTFSRIGIATLALTALLSVLTLGEIPRRLKIVLVCSGALAAAAVVPFINEVFREAGDEAGGSAEYRGGLFSLIPQVRIIGETGDWTGLTVGGDYLGAYADSVDNSVLVFALRFGWIPAALLVAVLILASVRALSPAHVSSAAVAIAAQLPTLFAVALITQFGMYMWFLAGLAITWGQIRSASAIPELEEGFSSWSARPGQVTP